MPPTEKDRQDIQKAMAYDLLKLLKKKTESTFSYEELEELIDAYITGAQQ